MKAFPRGAALAAALCFAACLFDGPQRVAGGGSETEYLTLSGKVTLPDGSPAAGCRIAVRPAGWLYDPELPPGPGAFDTLTDAKGGYAFRALTAGAYVVEGRLRDTLGFAARIELDSARRRLRADAALERTGALSLRIAEPLAGVDYFVQAYGLERHVLADSLGNARVTLPPGTFRIRVISSPKAILPAEFDQVAIRPGADTALPEVHLSPAAGPAGAPLIFDSNIGFAVDDAAALALLHALEGKGEARLIAAGTANPSRASPAVLGILDAYYGRPGIPVGAWKGEPAAAGSGYDSIVAREFPSGLPPYDSLPDAFEVYRRALEGQPDGATTILCTGDVRNAWALLRAARPLIARKVKVLVIVGGRFPSGKEFNFSAAVARDTLPNLIREVNADWPGTIHFVGAETGDDMASGGCLATAATGGPLKRIYDLGIGAPAPIRISTDLVGALYAARGPAGIGSLVTEGSLIVNDDGSNAWTAAPDADRAYLVRAGGPETVAAAIDSVLCAIPKP
jgi:hypothetical protein